MSRMFNIDQTIDPDFIFIRPRTADEWKIVANQVLKDIMIAFPRKREDKIQKMFDRIFESIKDHVMKGGIVELPKDVVMNLEIDKKV